jgi:polyhydroxybutyrate depolymerase
MRSRRLALLAVAASWIGGCGNASHPSEPTPTPTPALVVARPFGLKVPTGYTTAVATPLVLVLHGYGATGQGQATYFGLLADADEHGYLLAYPDGTVDSSGNRFWNATDACCNFYGRSVDDVAYLGAVIDDVQARYNVDAKRVYVVGHSNGGFMAHRLACDLSGRIAAAVSLAGAVWKQPERCQPTSKINVLQVHGDADDTIFYTGSAGYPSALETVALWAQRNSCSGALAPAGPDKDIDTSLAGAETATESYDDCAPGGAADLWTIRGGKHVPALGTAWADALWEYFRTHAKL